MVRPAFIPVFLSGSPIFFFEEKNEILQENTADKEVLFIDKFYLAQVPLLSKTAPPFVPQAD